MREETDLRLGLEVDFVPGREDRTQNLIERCELDYVVGSVHFLGELAVDCERYDIWETGAQRRRQVWRRYFETLAEAARSGLFDILAHPDLVKMWGPSRPRPDGDLRRYYEPALEAIAETGHRRRGLDRRAAQARRARSTRRRRSSPGALEAGAPVALSSDAHLPRAGRLRLRPGARAARRRSACASSRCSSGARGAWSRSAR